MRFFYTFRQRYDDKRRTTVKRGVFFLGAIFLGFALWTHGAAHAADTTPSSTGHLMTVYDRGDKKVFLTHAATVKQALIDNTITLDANDTVEPSLDEKLIASEYHVNIYRARPVTVIDGAVRIKVMTPYQVADRIAKSARITLYPEDKTSVTRSSNIVGDGAGLELTITRATPFTFDLYGKKSTVRTQATTVGAMLKEKKITLGANDKVSVDPSTPITAALSLRVWREGKQTITVDEDVPFSTDIIYDADRPLGYRAAQVAGVVGVQSVTYQVEIKEGVEISRSEIARITTKEASKQTDVIGLKNDGSGLSRNRGALFRVDSKGVTHRETYYDLNMHVVMQACGQGGRYTVRPDGVKVDANGYVIIAANYARYPRCSIVETSVGLGKVYDTGGFVSRYPDGFDIATDWSREDGI